MKQTRIARAFLRELSERNLSQSEYSDRCGLGRSVITYMLRGRRPSPEVLRGLVMHWPNPDSGIAVLAAHLRDEIDHAGGQHDRISIGTGERTPIDLTDALRELEAEARISPATRDLILDMAQLLREFHARPYASSAEDDPQEDRRVAEQPAKYERKKTE